MTRSQAASAPQCGQALIEFLVLALVLIPLFLLIPMVGKYQDIGIATQLASRYLAFEAMTHNDSVGEWTPESNLANDVRRRFFSNPSAPIKTGDTAGDFKADQNPLWRDPVDEALIRSFNSDITISFGSAVATKHQDGFSNASDERPFVLYSPLSLQARGTYTAGVTVDIASLPAGLSAYEPFDQLHLKMTRRTTVLLDHWAGRDPVAVQAHLNNVEINAGQLQRPMAPAVKLAVYAAELPPWGRVLAPKLGEFDFWQDTVPIDRLYKP